MACDPIEHTEPVEHKQLTQGHRILIVTPSLPYPPIWGFGIRVYQFVRLLARNHNVTLLTYAEEGEGSKITAIEEACATVHTVHMVKPTASSDPGKRAAQLASLVSPISYQRRSLYTPQMQQKLDELAAQEKFDIIQVESSQLAGYRFDARSTVVLDEHNIEYELLYRMYQSDRSPARRLYNWMEFRKFRREEIKSWHDSCGCVMTSAREAEIVRKIVPSKPVEVVANAVDIEYFRPSGEAEDSNAIVLTGLMRYRPNIDAAVYFVKEIFPRILASRPNMVFYIVGAGAPEELKRLAGPNVVVTDTVPDVRPYVHRSAVFVVPLRMGSGTRLKVLEGLAMEKAMVSTSLGCEGIDVGNGEHLLIADDVADFADSVLKLVDDREMAARLGRQGRELVERQYSWETVVAQLESFHKKLLAARAERLN